MQVFYQLQSKFGDNWSGEATFTNKKEALAALKRYRNNWGFNGKFRLLKETIISKVLEY